MNEDFSNGSQPPRPKIKLPRQEETDLGSVSFEDSQSEDIPPTTDRAADNQDSPTGTSEKLKPHHRVKHWYLARSTWQQVVILILVLALLGMALWAAWGVFHRQGTLKVSGQNPAPAAPTTVPSAMTGLQVDPEVNKKQVTGVMIENSVFARPQSGLDTAGVVFEALAEGGITRFMALYQDTGASYLGPVRSARPYYVQWCLGFDCAYAHVGGSPEALSDIKKWNVKDLNQFYGAQYFHRISSRAAPHNVYTSTSQLAKYEKSKGYDSSSYTGFQHLAAEPKIDPDKVTVKSISLNYPGTSFDVSYKYDAETNTYKRSEGGAKHYVQDSKGKKTQLAPKVVVVMAVRLQNGKLDSSNAYYSDYQTIGSGTVRIFQNGKVITGTWKKASNTSQITFTDNNGKAIQLTPGQAWVSVLSSINDVKYKVVEPVSANTGTSQTNQ